MDNSVKLAAGATLPVSVVIPFYNAAAFLGEALQSVRQQTRQPLEVIIVDDGSRAEEARELDAIGQGCMVVHLEKNRGVSVARNVGISRARGCWVAFLDADDMWMPDKLQVQWDYLSRHPGCRAIHGGLHCRMPDGEIRTFPKRRVEFTDLFQYPPPVFPSALLVERDLLMECGLFDPNLRAAEDLDLSLRITQVTPIEAVPEVLAIRRVRREGLSRNLPLLWRCADTVYRRFIHVLNDPARIRKTLLDLHAEFVCEAFYSRNWTLFRQVLVRISFREIGPVSVLARAGLTLIRTRLQRGARRSSGPATGLGRPN
jgi:glycosyltransferase involved in cell wall biosynthesis